MEVGTPKARFARRLHCSAIFVSVFASIAAARGDERNAPALSPADEVAMPISAAADSVAPPGLPTIGKWMISADGAIAHWLGEIYEGKRLREPINVILVDAAAASVDDAKQRLVEAAAAAGYPIRFGHSTGYRALIGGQIYAQLPAGRDDAFSNRIFELSNNHGRIFGPSIIDGAYVFIGAFSREEVRPLRWPEHGYASFNRARDDFSQDLDRTTQFKLSGFIDMANAIIGDPEITTGDHDRLAVLLRAGR
jgi:hypothetical protein